MTPRRRTGLCQLLSRDGDIVSGRECKYAAKGECPGRASHAIASRRVGQATLHNPFHSQRDPCGFVRNGDSSCLSWGRMGALPPLDIHPLLRTPAECLLMLPCKGQNRSRPSGDVPALQNENASTAQRAPPKKCKGPAESWWLMEAACNFHPWPRPLHSRRYQGV